MRDLWTDSSEEHPARKKPAEEHPAGKKPTEEQPAAKKPAEEHPTRKKLHPARKVEELFARQRRSSRRPSVGKEKLASPAPTAVTSTRKCPREEDIALHSSPFVEGAATVPSADRRRAVASQLLT
ncbi:hypothetical protein BHE74_00044378 [Ensete ventricosum]|nr:hypothetical protein BHE74_00044378 [Ensete ventricosum]